MWKFNAKTPHEYVLKLKAYSMTDCADKIAVSHLSPTPKRILNFQAKRGRLYEAYAVKRVYALHVRDAAEEHCQAGASLLSNQRVFD